MIIDRPRKSDTALVFIGAVIFILLLLGVFFVVRRQPEVPRQAPNAPGAAITTGPQTMFDYGQYRPASAQTHATPDRAFL